MPKDRLPKLITTLNRKNCIRIIRYIKDGKPKRNKEIKDEFSMKDKTLGTVLRELCELRIIEKTILEKEKGRPHAYIMTSEGMSIYGNLNSIGQKLGGWYEGYYENFKKKK